MSNQPKIGLSSTKPRATRILVVDDEENIRVTLELCLEAGGHQVTAVGTAQAALDCAARQTFEIIFLDVRLGVSNGLDLIPRLLAENPTAKVIVITAYASAETAITAMDRGAADYLPKPFTPAQVQLVVRKMLEQRRIEMKLGSFEAAQRSWLTDDEPFTTSSEMRQALDLARRLAAGDTALLIVGEPGTGKEQLARAIHGWSGRAAGVCTAVSCANVSAEALEGILFGRPSRGPGDDGLPEPGAAALCDGGTLILKEIAATPLTLQPLLVRLLREKEFEQPEKFATRRSDVRVIATTTQDLDVAAARQKLRADLLMAVNIVQIELPPIRERVEDIRLFADRFCVAASRASHCSVRGFAPEALEALTGYSWPGNLRQLREVVERAVQRCQSGTIELEHLPPQLLSREPAAEDLLPLDELQEKHIRRVLQGAKSMEAAAAILGIDPATLWRRRRQYGLE